MISIIIVNYNGKRFLQKLLNSVSSQSFTDYEVVLVDNGSKDDSVQYISDNYPEVKVIKSENLGYGCACNLGVEEARGEWVCFFNEDMHLPVNFLQNMLDYRINLQKSRPNIKVGAIACKIVDYEASIDSIPDKFGGILDLFGFPKLNRNRGDVFIVDGCPLFMSKATYISVGGFNENIFIYGEDIDISWRLKIFGYQNFINNTVQINHFGGGATGSYGVDKIASVITSSFIPIVTNYSALFLCFLLPIYFIYMATVSLFLFIVKGFNLGYPKRILIDYKNHFGKLHGILKFRAFVQRNRVYGDRIMLKYVSLKPAFISNLSYKKLDKNYIIKHETR